MCLLDAENDICIQLIQWIMKLIRRLPSVIRRISRGHLAIFESSLKTDVRFWPKAAIMRAFGFAHPAKGLRRSVSLPEPSGSAKTLEIAANARAATDTDISIEGR